MSCRECGHPDGMHAWNCVQALADVGIPAVRSQSYQELGAEEERAAAAARIRPAWVYSLCWFAFCVGVVLGAGVGGLATWAVLTMSPHP